MLLSLWEEAITYSYLENINQQIQVSHCQRTIQWLGTSFYLLQDVTIWKHLFLLQNTELNSLIPW